MEKNHNSEHLREDGILKETAAENKQNKFRNKSSRLHKNQDVQNQNLNSSRRQKKIHRQQGILFQKKQELVTNSYFPEVYYNFGRAQHQLGIVALAFSNYLKRLELLDEMDRLRGMQATLAGTSPEEERLDHLTIKRTCAYNLQLLLCAAGNFGQAKRVVDKYLVI